MTSSDGIPPSLLPTRRLKDIAVDYTPEVCQHKKEQEEHEICITFDARGGARWRSHERFKGGTFSALMKGPSGNTSGLNYNLYLSSLEGDKSQDEIDFEFLGKDKCIVQTNFLTTGIGNREQIHDLGFDSSADFHEYCIRWSPDHRIEWLVDGHVIRVAEKQAGEDFPSKPMFLYASVWDASYIDNGTWCGIYDGRDAPFICRYRNVCVPACLEE